MRPPPPPTPPPPPPPQPPPTRPPSGDGPAVPCPIGGGVRLPDRTRCDVYHICIANGQTIERACSAPEVFDWITGECTQRTNARCWREDNQFMKMVKRSVSSKLGPAIACNAERTPFIPDKTRCNVFHICGPDGETAEARCHPSMIFDFDKGVCTNDPSAKCWSDLNNPSSN